MSIQTGFGDDQFRIVPDVANVNHLVNPVNSNGTIVTFRYWEESGGKAITMTFVYIIYDRYGWRRSGVEVGDSYPHYYRYRKGNPIKEHLIVLRHKVNNATDTKSPFKVI